MGTAGKAAEASLRPHNPLHWSHLLGAPGDAEVIGVGAFWFCAWCGHRHHFPALAKGGGACLRCPDCARATRIVPIYVCRKSWSAADAEAAHQGLQHERSSS